MLKPLLVKNVEVGACYRSMRLLWGSEFAVIQTKNRSICENAVTGIWGSCELLVMGSFQRKVILSYRTILLVILCPISVLLDRFDTVFTCY